MRRTWRLGLLWVVGSLAIGVVASPGTAGAQQPAAVQGGPPAQPAQPAPAAAAPAPHVALGPGVAQKLKSGDANVVKGALDEARLAGKGAASVAPIIADLLQKGMPYPLTEAALDTLGDIEAESASATIAWYTHHRDPVIRRAAVKSLIHTKGPAATKALRASLSDGDAVVRGSAATGLGALKAKEAVADLFVALDHRVNEAAASIGQLCSPAECDALLGRMGKLPFDVVTSGLDPILFRPTAEVSDDAKIKVIGRVRELGTAEANRFLRDVQKRWPTTWSQRIKQSIDQAVLATAGGSGGGGGQ
jgi:HEAT repeat protein